MLSEILLYQIKIKQSSPFLYLFTRKQNLLFEIHYRIDEDRVWFTKSFAGKVLAEHHTKNNIPKSFSIMEGIKNRFIDSEIFNEGIHDVFSIYDIRKEKPELFETLLSISKDVEQLSHKAIKKEPMGGLLLSGK